MARRSSSSVSDNLGFATVDLDRARRQGIPEIIFGAGKTPEEIVGIVRSLHAKCGFALVTRSSAAAAKAVQAIFPEAKWHPRSGIIRLGKMTAVKGRHTVGILCAGTSDLPVAEEAAMCAEAFGLKVRRFTDIGVAGLHRLLEKMPQIRTNDVLIVIAGMEGALPTVVAGLVSQPVIAVPTSVGYGASFHGLSALLAMLNSCGSGLTVVNIDNGFGAAFAAARIFSLGKKR